MRPSRSWAPTVPARPRYCGPSPARTSRPAAASCSKAPTSPPPRPIAGCGRAWPSFPKGGGLFPDLTVEENLLVAGAVGRPGPWNVETVLEAFPILKPLRKKRAANLSGGEQQANAIGRALMTNPRLLLLDEVSLGLAPVAVEGVYRSLQTLIGGGSTIMLVEQDLSRALKVATRIICMLEGRTRSRRSGGSADPAGDHRSVLRARPHAPAGGRGMTVVNALIQGIMLGGFYALLACGLSLLFGVMRIINLAHGALAVLGAFLAWAVVDKTGISPFLALMPILVIMFGVGYALQTGHARAKPTRGRAHPPADHLRAGDRDRERPARDLLTRRALHGRHRGRGDHHELAGHSAALHLRPGRAHPRSSPWPCSAAYISS